MTKYVFDRKAWRHALVDAEISQMEAARRTGIAPGLLSLKVNGKVVMTANEYLALCDVVGVTPIGRFPFWKEAGK